MLMRYCSFLGEQEHPGAGLVGFGHSVQGFLMISNSVRMLSPMIHK